MSTDQGRLSSADRKAISSPQHEKVPARGAYTVLSVLRGSSLALMNHSLLQLASQSVLYLPSHPLPVTLRHNRLTSA